MLADLTVRREPYGVIIESAGPQCLISDELLDEIERGYGADFLTLTDDDVLTIRATNRTVVYRIDRDQYDAERHAYLMEWPD